MLRWFGQGWHGLTRAISPTRRFRRWRFSHAKATGLSRGVFLSGLLDGVTPLSSGERRDHLAALIRASAELSTLSRNVRHLADLLRSSDFSAAREYRGMLDSLAGDIARRLEVSGTVLSEMSPAHRNVRRERRFRRSNKETV